MKAGLVLMGAESGASNNSTFHAQIALQSQSGIKSGGLARAKCYPSHARVCTGRGSPTVRQFAYCSFSFCSIQTCCTMRIDGECCAICKFKICKIKREEHPPDYPWHSDYHQNCEYYSTMGGGDINSSLVYNLVYFTDPLS